VRSWPRLLLVLAGSVSCARPQGAPVCGLHSAGAALLMTSQDDRPIAVGSKLSPGDRVKAQGPTLLECFGGALKVLERRDAVLIGELPEARIEATTVPRFVLRGLTPVALENALPMAMLVRYSDTRFTPQSALGSGDPSNAEYLRAFFTPDGLATLGQGARAAGPSSLPPPPGRVAVPRVHAGPLGSSRRRLEVEDEFIFAETDTLSTAVLLEDQVYDLGATVRLVLPAGAEATYIDEGQKIDLEGPMDLRLR
jgi:hypothetical protein